MSRSHKTQTLIKSAECYSSKCVQQTLDVFLINTLSAVSRKCNFNCLAPNSLTYSKMKPAKTIISDYSYQKLPSDFEKDISKDFEPQDPPFVVSTMPGAFACLQTMKVYWNLCMLLLAQSIKRMNHSSAFSLYQTTHRSLRVFFYTHSSPCVFSLCVSVYSFVS